MDKLTRITFFVVLLMNLDVAGYAQDVMRDNTLNYAQELKPKFEYHVEPLTIEPHYSVELTNNSKRQRVVRATIDPSTLISDGVFSYSILGDNSVALVGLSDNQVLLSGDVVIPDEVQIDDITYHVDSVYCSLSEIVDSRGVINLDIQAPFSEIPNAMFDQASQLKSIKFPSTLKSIGDFAFNFSGLTGDLVLPEGLISIGKAAFQACERLTGELVIPKSLTSVGAYAFFCCGFEGQIPSLDKLNDIPEALFYACSGLTGELVLPEGLTSIGDGAFAHCSGLTGELVFPKSLTSVGAFAFYGCGFSGQIPSLDKLNDIPKALFYACSGLTGELVLPEGLTSIGSFAFAFCSGLTGELVLPEGLISIGSGAFEYCSGLTGNLVLPESLIKIGVKDENDKTDPFGGCTFSNCSGFTGVLILPKGLTEIGYCDFCNCSGFTGDLILPEGLTSIGLGAFDNCSGFTGDLILPEGLTSIGEYAFYECSGFTGDLVLPEGLTSIGDRAFYTCSGFTGDLVLPVGLTSISDYTFSGCNGFTGELVLPEGLTSIGDGAFVHCSGFTGKLVLPDGLTSIGDRAFDNCSGFTGKLVLPKGLTSIGKWAFWELNFDLYISYAETPGNAHEYCFGNPQKGLDKVLVVPVGSKNTYANAKGWMVFKKIVEERLAESITLNNSEITLKASETAELTVTVLPESTTDKSVTWMSSDESVVTVDAYGMVTAITVGEATIIATTNDGSNLSATCKVIVEPTIAESIILDKTEISLKAEESVALIATILPESTTDKSVIWMSSDESVATVDENGVVTAIAVGEATITATTNDGSNLSASCKVTIPTLAVSIEVTPNSVEAEENSEVQLLVNILPENATYKSVEWSSSNDAIASVNANGLVKIRKEGNVVITATTTDGTNLSATCRINVYSGIDGVNGDNVIVATIGDNIVVKNAKLGSVVNVYSSNGALIKSMTATDGSVVIEAPVKGIYVVAIDGKSFKVMVK